MTLLLLLACAPEAPPPAVDAAIVATTLATDYTTGTLSAVDPTGAVHDHLATVHADAVVRYVDSAVYVVNRLLMDTVRRYEPGAWDQPTWETSAGEASNPQDVALCGGALFVSRYEDTHLLVLDPATGAPQGEVDLSAEADDDGLPEAADLVPLPGDRLAVGLQRLHRLDAWTPDPEGRVVILDCLTRRVLSAQPIGANPVLRATPTGAQVLAANGAHDLALDGAPPGPVWVPPGEDAAAVDGASSEAGTITITRTGSRHAVWCAPPGEAPALVDDGERYLASVTVDAEGVAWIAERPGWSDPSAPGGLSRVALDGCERREDLPFLPTALPPFSVVALDASGGAGR